MVRVIGTDRKRADAARGVAIGFFVSRHYSRVLRSPKKTAVLVNETRLSGNECSYAEPTSESHFVPFILCE